MIITLSRKEIELDGSGYHLCKRLLQFFMLSYGVPTDFMDQYIRIGESTVIESLRRFVIALVEVFGEKYLRSPNENDTSRLLAIGQRRGFPGMFGSLDCMHWR
jgi:hypothetical protein